jgi:hypothetical protein
MTTKLEELKAAAYRAEAAAFTAYEVWAATTATYKGADDAWDAYYDELKKTQEENSGD